MIITRSLPWPEVKKVMSEYSNALRCSGYSSTFRAEVIAAALKGFRRQCQAADSGTGPPLFRPRSYERETRRNKKLRSKESWYRPHHDIVGFVPPSPGGELLAGLQKIVKEEGNKIGMKIKLVEQSGVSVKTLLTRPDLSGCLHPECDIAENGASHSRRGANYTGECTVCGNQYRGETGSGAHTRISSHKADIRTNNDTNSMAAHLTNEHPEHTRDPLAIRFSVNKTGPKCLERQVREAVQLANMDPDKIINTHMEFVAPAIQRMTHTNLLDNGRDRGQGQ